MVRLRTPTHRRCERCGRREHWNDESWVVVRTDDGPVTGDPFCLHEWDITGTFSPIATTDGS
jgi:hypothetical protein